MARGTSRRRVESGPCGPRDGRQRSCGAGRRDRADRVGFDTARRPLIPLACGGGSRGIRPHGRHVEHPSNLVSGSSLDDLQPGTLQAGWRQSIEVALEVAVSLDL